MSYFGVKPEPSWSHWMQLTYPLYVEEFLEHHEEVIFIQLLVDSGVDFKTLHPHFSIRAWAWNIEGIISPGKHLNEDLIPIEPYQEWSVETQDRE